MAPSGESAVNSDLVVAEITNFDKCKLFLTCKNNSDSIKKSLCPQYVIKVGPKPTNYGGTKPDLVGLANTLEHV